MAASDMPPPLRSAEPTADLLDAERATLDSLPHIATTLAFPDGPGIAAETAEVLEEDFLRRSHAVERSISLSQHELPWWKRPSPWW